MTPEQITAFYLTRFVNTKSVVPAFHGCDMSYTFGYEQEENFDLIQEIFIDWIVEKYGAIIANFSAPLTNAQLSEIENIITTEREKHVF